MADMETRGALAVGDALIGVAVQNDFLPDGSLAVPHGDAVVPVLNRYLAAFAARRLAVFATDVISLENVGNRVSPDPAGDACAGQRLAPAETLGDIRRRAAEPLRRMNPVEHR
jgi:nicotinamidase-related amidase